MTTAPAPEWEPGDPLYARSQYRSGLFSFRFDADGDGCLCGDRASWPNPEPKDALAARDELAEFIDRLGRDRRRGMW